MEHFFVVLNQIGIFLILLFVGMITVKLDILDQHALGNVAKLIMKLSLPAYIFINTVEGATRQGLLDSLMILPLTVVMYLALISLSALLERVFHLKGNRARVFRTVILFGNVGFLGIPMVTAIYPETALLYIALFSIIDQGVFWTYGVSLTYPVDHASEEGGVRALKNLLSPALVAIVVGTIMVLLQLELPGILSTAFEKLGDTSMPLSMLYIGGMLTLTDIHGVLRCKELYAGIVAKMLALPLVYWTVLQLLGVTSDAAGIIVFLTALPSVNMVAMLAKSHGSDGDYAVCSVMMTTLASLVTLPLLAFGMAMIG